jgi:hypothetical protein
MGESDKIMVERVRKTFYRQQLLEKSRLYCSVRDIADRISSGKSESTPEPDFEKGPFRVSLDEFEENLLEIADKIRNQLHAVPIFVTRQDLRKGGRVFLYNDVMRKVAEKMDVPLVDVQLFFAGRPDPPSLYSKPKTDSIHPNSKGYDAVAQLVFETIQSNGLIDSPRPSP